MATGDGRANDILDAIYGSGRAAGLPATVYFALYTSAPTDAGGGTEAAYAGYARVAKTNNTTNFPAAADREKTCATEVVWPTPTATTPQFVAFAIHGHATNDDLLHWELLASPFSADAGEPIKLPADVLSITIP